MDLAKSIRTAYFQALDGVILLNGDVVPLYDTFAPPEVEESYPYILLTTQTDTQISNKTCKIFNATLLVDIVTGSERPTGRWNADDIGEQIEDIINPDSMVDIILPDDEWSIGNTEREQSSYLTERSTNFYIYRKLLRYNHLISKH